MKVRGPDRTSVRDGPSASTASSFSEAWNDDRPDRSPDGDTREAQPRRALDARGGVRHGIHGPCRRAPDVAPLTTRKAPDRRRGRGGASQSRAGGSRNRSQPTHIAARARLFDAAEPDREVSLTRELVASLEQRQLLWVDVDSRDSEAFQEIADILDIPDSTTEQILEDAGRAGLTRYRDAVHLKVEAIEAGDEDDQLARRELDLLARRNLVLTVHDGPIAAIQRFEEEFAGDTLIGELDAGAFLAALVDTVLTTYFARVEVIEGQIDRLDEVALGGPDNKNFLIKVLALRRRVAVLRRTIAPHREALAPLARSDVALGEVIGHEQPMLLERLERVIESVENARELLIGSLDIYLGGSANRTNEVMKVLTILSAILLPGVALAGIMGMNFKMDFFDTASNFWVVIGAIVVLAVAILGVARARHWI